ncbi:TolB-like translocation protein [Archangium lipolyticum]|uniref:hypothetical protein n=1 Tax=Archangium lipolyticum TaxID=2970465 RepID=UPI00214A237E|nr:hypothetical protein [Archangium lipolyticum]
MLRTPILLVCLLPALALGQTVGAPIHGKSLVINNGPGDQTDPHVSGPVVSYTQRLSISSSEIHYHDVLTGTDRVIPNEGGFDSSSEVSGDTVVFTRTTSGNRVYRFNVRKGGMAEELAPRTGADRRAVAIGNQTVAWQELGYTAGSKPAELFAFRLDSQALTLLTDDLLLDKTPAVSADGSTVVWAKCATSTDGCDIWSARTVEGGYEVAQLTGTEGEDSAPDTNGEVAVYVTARTVNGVLESDIAWQPVGGGLARYLPLPGADANPSISGPLIAFEQKASATSSNVDVVLYDLRTQTYYRLTDTPETETLSDISVEPDGLVRVVWAVRQEGDLNVYAYVFRLPTDCAPTPTIENPAAVCALPGARPLLGSLQVNRSSDTSEVASLELNALGTGVLCVDNGYKGSRATAGRVWLGPGLHVGPESFGLDVPGAAKAVPLQGSFKLSAQADGVPGGAFQVRVYGEPSCDVEVGGGGPTKEVGEIHHGQLVPSVPVNTSGTKGRMARGFVPSGYEGLAKASGSGFGTGGSGLVAGVEAPQKPFPGCGAAGGPVSVLGVWLFAALSFRHRTARNRARAAARR